MLIYFHKFQQYSTLLKFWQTKFNLISSHSLNHMWERHFLDSIQLLKFMKMKTSAPQIIFDLGSGAGFPSVVLAIIDTHNTYYAIEANSKKCVFLHHVKRELQLNNLIIINMRIEDFILQNKKANIVIARALTDLNSLLLYAKQLLHQDGYSVFLKGTSYQSEMEAMTLQVSNLFSGKVYHNLFHQTGKILVFKMKN